MSALRRVGSFVLGALRRFGRGLRGLLRVLIPLAAVGALGVGAYLLWIKEDENKVGYEYANLIGGEQEPIGCFFSEKKPDVQIVRTEPQSPGDTGKARTQITLDGEGAFAFEEECDGAEPQIKVESVSMTLPGVVAIQSRPTEPKGKGKGNGDEGGKGKPKGRGK